MLVFHDGKDEDSYHLTREAKRRIMSFIAQGLSLSDGAKRLVADLQEIMLGAIRYQHPLVLQVENSNRRIVQSQLAELLTDQLISISADGTKFIPLWNLETTLEVNDEQRAVGILFVGDKSDRNSEVEFLAEAEAYADLPVHRALCVAEEAGKFLSEEEAFVDPFLRNQAVKMVGERICNGEAEDKEKIELLIGNLRDNYELSLGSLIYYLSRPQVSEYVLGRIPELLHSSDDVAFSSNLIELLGRIDCRDDKVASSLINDLIDNYHGAYGRIRLRYNCLETLARLASRHLTPELNRKVADFYLSVINEEIDFLKEKAMVSISHLDNEEIKGLLTDK